MALYLLTPEGLEPIVGAIGEAGSPWSRAGGTTHTAAASAVANSADEARPPGFAKHSATTKCEPELVELFGEDSSSDIEERLLHSLRNVGQERARRVLEKLRGNAQVLVRCRCRHIQLQYLLSDSLRLFLKDAARSVVRGRGPVGRPPVVRLEELVGDGVPGCWADQARFEFGPVRPWGVFVVACWWMLRGAEVLALRRGQCAVKVGERRLAEVRLGQTKADIEGRGKRRCFLCICVGTVGSDVICPSCALEILLRNCPERASGHDCGMLLVVGPRGGQVNHAGLARVWRDMLEGSARYTDAGDVTEVEVTEHTPRRAGCSMHVEGSSCGRSSKEAGG